MLGSRSVLLLDGAEHLRQRRLMLPPFHGERMRAYGDVMREVGRAPRSRAGRAGGASPCCPSMQAITLEVILRAVFGVEDPRAVERLGAPLRRLLDTVAQPRGACCAGADRWARPGRLSPWARFAAVAPAADELLHAEIAARRAEPAAAERDDVLSLLLAARDEDGEPLTDEELRDELMTLLVAGHETTATRWRGRSSGSCATRRCWRGCWPSSAPAATSCLDATIKETLRLRPVVPAVVRQLQRADDVRRLGPARGRAHRAVDLPAAPAARPLPRPARVPARALPRRDAPGTYEWIPFGGGIRRCLGASFALFEMKVVLRTLLRTVELQPAAGRASRGAPGDHVRAGARRAHRHFLIWPPSSRITPTTSSTCSSVVRKFTKHTRRHTRPSTAAGAR